MTPRDYRRRRKLLEKGQNSYLKKAGYHTLYPELAMEDLKAANWFQIEIDALDAEYEEKK